MYQTSNPLYHLSGSEGRLEGGHMTHRAHKPTFENAKSAEHVPSEFTCPQKVDCPFCRLVFLLIFKSHLYPGIYYIFC